jgi:hypothetical protein
MEGTQGWRQGLIKHLIVARAAEDLLAFTTITAATAITVVQVVVVETQSNIMLH